MPTFRQTLRDLYGVVVQGRSPRWPAARRAHLSREPACAACGGTARLQVHHVMPFHLDPSRELDPANLLTLCECPGSDHHFLLGHNGTSWSDYNPNVRLDALRFRTSMRRSLQTPLSPT